MQSLPPGFLVPSSARIFYTVNAGNLKVKLNLLIGGKFLSRISENTFYIPTLF
jgi:hypothetical protein